MSSYTSSAAALTSPERASSLFATGAAAYAAQGPPQSSVKPSAQALAGSARIYRLLFDLGRLRCRGHSVPGTHRAEFHSCRRPRGFGFYLLGVIAALIFVHESFDRWWRKIDCWQAFTAPIFFGIAWAVAHALHAPLTGLTAIGLSYGIGFITNAKVFRRLRDVLKFLIALRGGKEK